MKSPTRLRVKLTPRRASPMSDDKDNAANASIHFSYSTGSNASMASQAPKSLGGRVRPPWAIRLHPNSSFAYKASAKRKRVTESPQRRVKLTQEQSIPQSASHVTTHAPTPAQSLSAVGQSNVRYCNNYEGAVVVIHSGTMDLREFGSSMKKL